jgi:chaperone required for assembly of F1-ATPase
MEAGWTVMLDDRPVRLPGGTRLTVPTAALAGAIAAEWNAAGGAPGGEMDWPDVPLTRLAGTAQLRVLPNPLPTAEGLAAYAASDLLCYRAESPDVLVRRQADGWDPLLDWASDALGVRLRVTAGVVHVAQPPGALAAIARAFAAQDGWTLAGLGIAVPALESAVLGLAIAHRRLDAGSAHQLATLDERWQAELWGDDDEAAARRRDIAADIARAETLMLLARA